MMIKFHSVSAPRWLHIAIASLSILLGTIVVPAIGRQAYAAVTGVTVTPTTITTPYDTIPNFGGHPTITATQSGKWSDKTIWSKGGVTASAPPVTGDVVSIPSNITVTYDVPPSTCAPTPCTPTPIDIGTVSIDGTLNFRTDISTTLYVTNLVVMPDGALIVGTAATPVAVGVAAQIIFPDLPINTTLDPAQYGDGLIGLGTVTMHGTTTSDTFVRLATEPHAGDATLTLATAVTGWKAGDKLVLPDTRMLGTYELDLSGQGDRNYFVSQLEMPTVASVSSDGKTVTLSAALQFDHLGARDYLNVITFLPHVGNLTRNVVVKSANAHGTRGYTMFTTRANVDIEYAQFTGLGRSKLDPHDNTAFDANGIVTHVGANQQERNPITFIHLIGPATAQADGYQYTFKGNAVFCPIQPMIFRWGINVSDSHYGLIQDNVLYNWSGAGIMVEVGNESHNVIAHNFVAFVNGTGSRADTNGDTPPGQDRGTEGSGIWLQGPNNYIRDNVVTNVPSNGRPGQYYGYSLYFSWAAAGMMPAFQGADPNDPSQQVAMLADSMPILEFNDNEAYGAMSRGVEWWYVCALGSEQIPGADGLCSGQENIMKNMKIWNVFNMATFGYYADHLILDGWVIRGDWAKMAQGWTASGINSGDYRETYWTVKNSDIQGVGYAWAPSPGPQAAAGVATIQTIKDSLVCTPTGIPLAPIGTSFPAAWESAQQTVIDNVSFCGSYPYQGAPPVNIDAEFNNMNNMRNQSFNVMAPHTIAVFNYNGTPGDNFQVYFLQQAMDFVVPPSDPSFVGAHDLSNGGTPSGGGNPVSGLNNAQLWTLYSEAIAGAVAPANASASYASSLGIMGLVVPPNGSATIPTAPSGVTASGVVPASCTLPSCVVSFAAVAAGTGPITYSWNFGDGATGTGASASHSYTTAGTYTAVVTATNAQGHASANTQAITVAAAPAPAVVAPSGVSITGLPSGNSCVVGSCPTSLGAGVGSGTAPFTYTWSITNTTGSSGGAIGSNSTINPGFTTAGTYTVALNVSNSALPSGASANATVTVTAPVAPSGAAISASATSGTAPLAVSFTGSASGTSPAYGWDFGDGTTASGASASHSFSAAGSYSVTLTATNAQGKATATQAITVTAAPVAPSGAAITASASSVAAAAPMTFTGSASGTDLTYGWNFGDGSTGSGASVSHSYNSPGTYTVNMSANNSVGMAKATKTITVTAATTPVAPSGVTASADHASVTTALAVNFTAGATAGTAPITYSWDFGDGTTGSGASASHSYSTPGSYTATVTATNAQGKATATQAVTVTAPLTAPSGAAITASVTSGTAPLAVSFTGSASGTVTNYVWDFGDNSSAANGTSASHSFTAPGTYTVVLYAVNGTTQTTATKTITVTAASVAPSAAAITASAASVATSATVSFTGSASGTSPTYGWDFGDGTTASGASASHSYSTAGSYSVTLTAANPQGKATATKTITVTAPVTAPSGAAINASITSGQALLAVTFTGSASGPALVYSWDFGDGTTGSGAWISHNYSTPGNYTVTLTAANSGGQSTATQAITVTAPANASPSAPIVANASADVTSGAAPLTVTFTAAFSGTTSHYSWLFGDGTTGSGQTVTHTYTTPGNYQPVEKALDRRGILPGIS